MAESEKESGGHGFSLFEICRYFPRLVQFTAANSMQQVRTKKKHTKKHTKNQHKKTGCHLRAQPVNRRQREGKKPKQ